MRVLGLRVGPIDDVDLPALRDASPTYDHVGSTLEPQSTHGHRVEDTIMVGHGAEVLAAAKTALWTWVPQRGVGAIVRPDDVVPDLGETVVLGLGIGGVRLAVPNRIVAVVDEPDRQGYAYGTLPGHPERGEELFLLERGADDEVRFTIRVDAEPAASLRRLGAVIRPIQRAALQRYLRAVRDAVGEG